RRAGDRIHAELACLRQRHRHHAVFEGQRGKRDRVVLDPELAQAQALAEPARVQERRAAAALPDRGWPVERQELAEAPHAGWPAGERLAIERAADGFVIVDHLERAKAKLAHVQRRLLVAARALAAAQAEGGRAGGAGRVWGRRHGYSWCEA